jgi:hypothetical protein
MTDLAHCRSFAIAGLIAFTVTPALAQAPFRVETPGSAFEVESGRARVDNVAGGRRFRGEAHGTLTLRGELRLPPPALADARMMRLVVRFQTSPEGPVLRAVEYGTRSSPRSGFGIDTDLRGNLTGDTKSNSWDFKNAVAIGAGSALRLDVAFPGGFDSVVDPGSIVIASVSVDYRGKVPNRSTTVTPLPPPQAGVPAPAPSTPIPPPVRRLAWPKPTIPSLEGRHVRLDWCRIWGGECGKPAADAWCQWKGFPEAAAFTIDENIGNTAIISSKAMCTDPSCDGFASIECRP